MASMMNGSVYFGTVRQKSELIAEIVSIVGFSAVKNSDLFSSMIYADRLYQKSKPSKKLFSVNSAVESILNFEPIGKEADFKGFVDTLFKRVRKRSLLFIISDFIGDVDLNLLSKKHDIFAIIVRDRFEENPQELGYIQLIDMESRGRFEGSVDGGVISKYRGALEKNDDKLFRDFRKSGVRFTKIYTDEEPYIKLIKKMR